VQKDRLEYSVVGWGRDNETWIVDVGVLEGDPGQLGVWDDLTEKLTEVFIGETQEYRVQCAFIDSGYHAQMVYQFVKRNEGRRWFACKGMGDPSKPVVSKHSWVGSNPKVRLFPVGTTAAKDEIFSHLQVNEPGPGYIHVPDRPEFDDSYLKQLCSERKVTRYRLGVETKIYEKVSPNARNEALDTFVYATAARVKLNPNYEKIASRRLRHAEVVERPTDDVPPTETDPTPPGNPSPEVRRKRFRVLHNPFK
jgi:phage terminase large subunit GpA-like protein